MATGKLSRLFIPKIMNHLAAHRVCIVLALTSSACARHVWSDQIERFTIKREASFAPYRKTDFVEHYVRELSQQQLEGLKKLRWTSQGRCWEDVDFFYTMTVYDLNGKEQIFHAPDWNCGPSDGKRYIEGKAMREFFQALSQ